MDGSKVEPGESNDSVGWQYKPKQATNNQHMPADQDVPPDRAYPAGNNVEWQASEFIAHDKSFVWYLGLVGVTAIVEAIVYFIMRDLFSLIAVALVAVMFGVLGARQPKVLTYRLDNKGVHIGPKLYYYTDFKSFAIAEEEPFVGIVLLPINRFGLPLNMYLAPENEREILEALSNRLPMEKGGLDSVEQLMRRVRF